MSWLTGASGLRRCRVGVGYGPVDNWWTAWVPYRKSLNGETCLEGVWLDSSEMVAFVRWATSSENFVCDLRWDGDNVKLYADGDNGRVLPTRNDLESDENGKVTFYNVGIFGLLFTELDPADLGVALNVLKGYCREVPGMEVMRLDWWIATFGAEALGDFYAGLKKSGDVVGVKFLDQLLPGLLVKN